MALYKYCIIIIIIISARAMRMGMAYRFNACTDWSTVKKCRPTFREISPTTVADVFLCVGDRYRRRILGVGNICRRVSTGYLVTH